MEAALKTRQYPAQIGQTRQIGQPQAQQPRTTWFVGVLLTLLLCALPLARPAAQDFRGAIEGRITDDQGAAVPGVTVTVTNVETNIPSTGTSNADGNYSVPFLTPGVYKVSVELAGFKKVERDQVQVRVGDRLALDFQLQVGAIEEVVSVSAAAPLLETRSGSSGQVIDEKRIALMPLSDGNPFVLTRLAPGVAYFGDLKFSRPFDNGGTSDVNADGAPGGNEFSLDGSPNMGHGRRVAFVPPAGAVQEFKVETANFDAQQGHTAGATVNVTLKSGTNRFRGEGYYHYRDEKLGANDFFLERQGRPKAPLDYKRFGGVLGGPIFQDRTFFFSAVEWLYDQFPEPNQFTVPTEAQRNGDFSALLSQGIRIYDPRDRAPRERPHRAHGVPEQHHPGQSHQPGRARVPEVLSAAESGRRRARPQQFQQPAAARRRLLFHLRARRSPDHQQPEDLRPLQPQRPQGIPRRLGRRAERRQAHRQLPVPEERRRSTSTTCGRSAIRRC